MTSSGERAARLRDERAHAQSRALGKLIEEERVGRDWTQADLAQLLGMRQSGVATWEKGPPGFGALHTYNIMALEDVFEMPRGAILYRLRAVIDGDEIDFETYVMSRRELRTDQKVIFRDLHRVMVTKDWTE